MKYASNVLFVSVLCWHKECFKAVSTIFQKPSCRRDVQHVCAVRQVISCRQVLSYVCTPPTPCRHMTRLPKSPSSITIMINTSTDAINKSLPQNERPHHRTTTIYDHRYTDDGDDALMPLVRYGSTSRYEPAAESDAGGGTMGGMGIDSGLDASERDGLNTPPGLPSEPSWMSEPVLGEGGSGGAGGALGWRGGRRERGDGGGGSRTRTMV